MFEHYFQDYPQYYLAFLAVLAVCVVAIYFGIRSGK